MLASEQGTGPLLVANALAASHPAAVPSLAAPFCFSRPHRLIDWRALHGLNLAAVVRDTDLDALERVLGVLHSGDIEAEDPRNLTPANFIQLFRAAQLTLDYLLHVQDRLSADSGAAKAQASAARQRERLLQLKVREVQEELAGSRKEVKHLKKSLRSFEALALARPPAPPEVRLVDRIVEVPDPAAHHKLERLEAQLAQAKQESSSLEKINTKLADALAAAVAAQSAANGCADEAVQLARRQEQEAGVEKLLAALEMERRKHNDSRTASSVGVSGEGSPSLQAKLEAAQQRERQAEQRAEAAVQEAARASECSRKAAAAPRAEVKRLRADLQAARAEAADLRSRLAHMDGKGNDGTLAESGLGSELQDVNDEHVQQLEERVAALEAELARVRASLSKASARGEELEQQLRAARQMHRSSHAAEAEAAEKVARRAAEADVLDAEVERLRFQGAALKEEVRRLRKQAARDTAEIEHLTERLQQLAATRGRGSQPASRSVSPAKVPASNATPGQQRSPQRTFQLEVKRSSADPELVGSTVNKAGSSSVGRPGPGSRPSSAAGQRSRSPHASSRPPTSGQSSASPSVHERLQFVQEMCHVLPNAERPGVVGRFPHSLASLLALRPDLEVELEAELASELASFGLDPAAQQLSDSQLAEATAQLQRRRAAERRAMTHADQQRMDYMRHTVAWHVDKTAERAAGERDASPTKRPRLVPAPPLKPIRTTSRDAEEPASPQRRGFVEQVLQQVGDEAAVYSPLACGASVLSQRGYFAADSPSPRSSPASYGSHHLMQGGSPRSPWSLTWQGAFRADLEPAGSSQSAPFASRPHRPSPPASQAASPPSRPGLRTLTFGSPGDSGHVAAQRVGARPPFTGGAARAEAGSPGRPGEGAHARSPSSRRVVWQEREGMIPAEDRSQGCRDRDTGEAAPVRPAARHGAGAGW